MTKDFHQMKRSAGHWEEHKEEEDRKREEMENWQPDATLSATRTKEESADEERLRRIKQQGPDWD